ncbi:DUF262 domain-containing protein [Microbacterium sp. SL75]|uniref:DUF262 domain-containing protein n=1 Tax=Microbacterium sp. SL75 TaxID=2995140 RepID=UPI002270E0A6|nr:DUF262 domain-containing protein [Microbacterium sp. SL75]WAC67745.1 DUF262 domain-containing protein [Microbacterium sp. SL75]
MKLEPWEPDLKSLHLRYTEGSLDLQPAFQRGLVWPREKKARLVDTVLRGWRVPPVHLVVEEDESLSVLDGQQRLQALFDFIEGKVTVGTFAPVDESVSQYKGLTFSRLPPLIQRRILSARISTYRLYDFEPDEPYELFFRLNLPTGLTSAEKRNALSGTTRRQIREIVQSAAAMGWSKDLLGFSDGRLAYDDVVARLCAYLLRGSLKTPLTARDMEAIYRDQDGLPAGVIERANQSVELFTSEAHTLHAVKFNKATLLTWLLVAARASTSNAPAPLRLGEAMQLLERGRIMTSKGDLAASSKEFKNPTRTAPLVALYADRASLRVADVLSVQARDAVAWLAVSEYNEAISLPDIVRELDTRVRDIQWEGADAFELQVLELVSEWDEWSAIA